jgi:hypothetical protein
VTSASGHDTEEVASMPDKRTSRLLAQIEEEDFDAILAELMELDPDKASAERIVRVAIHRGLITPSPTKSQIGRPLGEKTLAIRRAALALAVEYEVMTVRQVFYQLVTRGVVPKSENGGYVPVQIQVLKMRREGLLDWGSSPTGPAGCGSRSRTGALKTRFA